MRWSWRNLKKGTRVTVDMPLDEFISIMESMRAAKEAGTVYGNVLAKFDAAYEQIRKSK